MDKQGRTEVTPNPLKVRLLEVLMNPEHATKTVTEQCKIAEIGRTSYYEYMKDPDFVQMIADAKDKMLRSAVLPSINALKKKASSGSIRHQELLFKMTGDYVEVTKQQIESQVTMEMKADIRAEVKAELEQEMKVYGHTVNTNINIPDVDLSKLSEEDLAKLEEMSDILSKAQVDDGSNMDSK